MSKKNIGATLALYPCPVLFEFPVSIMLWYQFFLLSFKNYVIVSSQLS